MKPFLTLTVTAILLQASPGFALPKWLKHDHQQTQGTAEPLSHIAVKPHEAVFEVHGIVCSFCSAGVRKKLSKLSFVDRSKYKKGVLVEIENQRVTIAIKPDRHLDIKAASKSIRSGGYDPVKVIVGGVNGSTLYNAQGQACTAIC